MAPGLAGIGKAVEYALATVVISSTALIITTAVLRLRYWMLAALSAGLLELVLVLFTWPFAHRVELAVTSSAVLCVPIATAVAVMVERCWPRRD